MRIGEAADRLGVTPRTIKYYEELGFLAPHRSGGQYRDLSEDDVERVGRIRHLQKLGFSLAAIQELMKYRQQVDERGCKHMRTADLEAVTSSLEARLAEIRQHIAQTREEVRRGEQLALELEADVARCKERLALRDAGASPAKRGEEMAARTIATRDVVGAQKSQHESRGE